MRPQGRAASTGPIKYVIDDGVARSFTPGALEKTASPLDVAIEGDGFFQLQTARGPRYTRDGRFTLNAQNQLTTQAGEPVLSASGAPITLDPKKGDVSIAKTGAISQGGVAGPKIGVYRFARLSSLSKTGNDQFSSPETPTTATDVGVRQGYLERSNVQPVLEITHLIEITRAYERINSMMNSAHELSRSAVQRLGRAA